MKDWRSVLKEQQYSILLFTLLFLNGSFVGLSDDEAYYWVLSQKPALGYAFHPPSVAWSIWLSERLLSWIPFLPAEATVRFPAALMSGLILGLALSWLKKVGLRSEYSGRAAAILLSFAGFFSLSWMMVPDLPLFLAWTLVFCGTWDFCFSQSKLSSKAMLVFGAAICLLSKYSGVLCLFSAALCILLWAPPKKKLQGLSLVILGAILAIIPICVWNYQHEWASILYQIRDRHSNPTLSWIRFLRFWAVELLLVGPVALGLGFWIFAKTALHFKNWIRRDQSDPPRFVLPFLFLFFLPPAGIFCIQPAYSDFKIHWAFIAWWPMLIGLAWLSQGPLWKWLKIQCFYGLSLGALVLVSCQLPVLSWVTQKFTQSNFDPRWDVTNDLYGWRDLRASLEQELGNEIKLHPYFIGSRYQTASQAYFYLRGLAQVTLLPRDMKEKDEWPSLGVTESEGPAPSRLNTSVYYVADNRYTEGPSFPSAKCQEVKHLKKERFGISVRSFKVWRCDP